MKLSDIFTKTRKDAPADEVAHNARLLIRAGFIHKEMAGVYSYLPLGLRVLRNIEAIIREEMHAIGGQEIQMTALQDPELWKQSGRWDDDVIDNWFKTQLANESELGLATTHEEPLARILAQHVYSYRDLPQYIFQFQTKFRNELRSKSGIMRGREFLMKDLYSFTRTTEELETYYERAAEAYANIFTRVGIGDRTFRTFASGGSFSKFSDEFQTLSAAGEDTIYLDPKRQIAVNEEVYTDDVLKEVDLKREDLREEKAIEVGNIFKLGTRFSEAAGLTYQDEHDREQPVVMGCYGIGLGRVMGTVVEVLSDEKGIVWPASIAPADIHLVVLSDDRQVHQAAAKLYDQLQQAGAQVIFDDREESAGTKLNDADLIGVPKRVVVSPKTLDQDSFEFNERATGKSHLIDLTHYQELL